MHLAIPRPASHTDSRARGTTGTMRAALSLSLSLAVAVITSTVLVGSTGTDPFDPNGPLGHQVARVGSFIFPKRNVSMGLVITVPSDSGTYPVLVLDTGLAGVVPAFMYSNVTRHIASHGFVVATLDRLIQLQTPKELRVELEGALDWMENNLNATLAAQTPGVAGDFGRSALAGHSLAGMAVQEYLTERCGPFSGAILLDTAFYLPEPTLPFQTPVLMWDNSLDPIGRCGPNHASVEATFAQLAGPVWLLNGTGFGHGDFLDNEYRGAARLFCGEGSHEPADRYRAAVGGSVVSFLQVLFGINATAVDNLELQRLQPTPAVGKWKQGNASLPLAGFCHHA